MGVGVVFGQQLGQLRWKVFLGLGCGAIALTENSGVVMYFLIKVGSVWSTDYVRN